ncbi:MAG: DUF308 domain-containing protein [Thermomicrobiales bacterium]
MSQRAGVVGAGSLVFELSKKWWVLLVRGILLILIGLIAFVNPAIWITYVGVYTLVEGISMLFAGIGNQPPMQSRWPFIVIGILSIIAGIIILSNQVIAGITLVMLIAAWAIVIGILEIIQAIRLREEIDNEWWLIITGVLAVIFGVLVFSRGAAGIVVAAITIGWVFGIFAILAGIFSIALAFRVRDFGTRIGAVT